VEGISQLALSDAQSRQELLEEDLAWMSGWAVGRNAGHRLLLSNGLAVVVIHDLDELGALRGPPETDPVALVYPDAVLAWSVASKAL
jgi:hypothetical protein